MPLIIQNFEKIIALTNEEKALILSKIEVKHYKAKAILLNAGEICKNIYFVNSGILRSYNLNDNIVEHVLHFASKGCWIGDMYSYISEKPGNLFIEVLKDAEVVTITKEKHQILYQEIPKLERFFRILAENSLVAHQERLIDNLSLTAEDRFEKMRQKYPNLMHKVAQKHIASYIGVTPEFFSKMKAKDIRR